MSLKFWKPGTAGPGSHLDRASEAEENVVPSAPAYSSLSIQNQRERLPIFKHRTYYVVELSTHTGYTIVLQETNSSIVLRNLA
jgi:ATP-dependent RNA helicase DDX35